MYVRSSFTVVNLHDLWNNYSRSISTVIDLVCESGRHPGGKPKSLRSDWSMSVSMGAETFQKVVRLWLKNKRSRREDRGVTGA